MKNKQKTFKNNLIFDIDSKITEDPIWEIPHLTTHLNTTEGTLPLVFIPFKSFVFKMTDYLFNESF